MPGGPSFLRPIEEFSTRLCYVDFDGAYALEQSRKIGRQNLLPENFVETHVTQISEGIDRLCDFVKQYK